MPLDVALSEPEVVDTLSQQGQEVFFDSRNLRHLLEGCLGCPKEPFDLNVGFEQYAYTSESGTKELKPIFEWIEHKADATPNTPLKELVHGADFVCLRGLLQQLMTARYEAGTGLLNVCMRIGDVIFMRQYDTTVKIELESSLSDRDKLMSYWGHKFETYVLSRTSSQAPPSPSLPSSGQRHQYCTLVSAALEKRGLVSHRLFYFAEASLLQERLYC